MLLNIPEEIDALRLKDFDFGSVDASNDELLKTCFCRTEPINEFLTGRYNILLGAKGVGKSAVFSQLGSQHA